MLFNALCILNADFGHLSGRIDLAEFADLRATPAVGAHLLAEYMHVLP